MYLYFNSDGVIKEVVNDTAIRQGNSGVNKIHFFIEGASPEVVNNVYKALNFDNGVRTFIDVEGNNLTTEAFDITTTNLEIPYNKKRELKYFKYWTKYEMFTISVPDNILNDNGTVGCRIQMILNEGSEIDPEIDTDDVLLTLGLVLFNVEITTGGKSIIQPDTAINIAQWNYLIKNMQTTDTVYTKAEIDAFLQAINLSLAGKELLSNKVTSLSGDSTDTQYPSAKAVWDLIADIKRSSYIAVDTTEYPTLEDFLASTGEEGYMYLYPKDTSDLSAGYYIYIWENNAWLYIGDTSLDLSPYVTLDTTQTITGTKTVKAPLQFTDSTGTYVDTFSMGSYGKFSYKHLGTEKAYFDSYFNFAASLVPTLSVFYDLGQSGALWNNVWASRINAKGSNTTAVLKAGNYSGVLGLDSVNTLEYGTGALWTNVADFDLGTSSHKWKDLYLAGNINLANSSIINIPIQGNYKWNIFRNTSNRLCINRYDGATLQGGIQLTTTSLLPSTATYDIGSSDDKFKDLYLSGEVKLFNGSNSWEIKTNTSNYIDISYNGSNRLQIRPTLIYPSGNFDIGTAAAPFRNLSLSGSIKGAATLTQAQYDALVSGGTVDSDTFYFIEEE